VPPGYAEIRSPAASWIAHNQCADEIQHGEADRLLIRRVVAQPLPGSGRGGTQRFRLGGVEVIGKRALHGGLLAPLLGGLYLGTGRILDQLLAADRLERAGVSTPAVLGVGWRRILGPFHAHAIITRAVLQAQNLYEAAREDAPWRRRRVVLEKSADLIRAMHDAGFVHADLNVTNLLIGRGGDGDRALIVDLDGGRFRRIVGIGERYANLARLLRSYEKWIAGRFRLSGREEIAFLRRYCRADREMTRFLQHRLQSYRGRLGLHRIGWKTPPVRERQTGRPSTPK
jgi:hypothetical protein